MIDDEYKRWVNDIGVSVAKETVMKAMESSSCWLTYDIDFKEDVYTGKVEIDVRLYQSHDQSAETREQRSKLIEELQLNLRRILPKKCLLLIRSTSKEFYDE